MSSKNMDYFQRYFTYLRNNPENYWFKRRLFGWGWVPAKREGWYVLVVYLLIFAWIVVPFTRLLNPSNSEVTWFLIKIVIWTALLIAVCYFKGEPPKWQWGLPTEKDK